jgi:hypothetical protein
MPCSGGISWRISPISWIGLSSQLAPRSADWPPRHEVLNPRDMGAVYQVDAPYLLLPGLRSSPPDRMTPAASHEDVAVAAFRNFLSR